MAITAEDRRDIITLVVGMFDAAPGFTILEDLVTEFENGTTLAQLAASLEASAQFRAVYPKLLTSEEFAERLVNNLVGDLVSASEKEWAVDQVLAALQSGSNRSDVILSAIDALSSVPANEPNWGAAAALLSNKVAVATYYSINLLKSSDDLAALQAVIADVTSDPASVVTVKAALDAPPVPVGQTFMLTASSDNFKGGAGDDTFNAISSSVATEVPVTTLTPNDKIDGGVGTDTFNLFATKTQNTALLGSVDNVEIINISGANFIGSTLTAAQQAAITAARTVLFGSDGEADGVGGAEGALADAQTSYEQDIQALAAAEAALEAADLTYSATLAAGIQAEYDVESAERVFTAIESASVNDDDGEDGWLGEDEDAVIAEMIAAAADKVDVDGSTADSAVLQAMIVAAGAPTATVVTVKAAAFVVLNNYLEAEFAAAAAFDVADEAVDIAGEDITAIRLDLFGEDDEEDGVDGTEGDLADALDAYNTADAALESALATAGTGNLDAAFFGGSEQIWLVGADSGRTNVNSVSTQTVGLRDVVATAVGVNYAAAVTQGAIALDKASGAVSVAGSKLATLSLSGTASTITLDDTTIGGTVKTLNLALDSASTVTVAGLDARATVNASASTGALKIDVGSTMGASETIIGGAGADTLVADISKIASYNPTVSNVETISLKYSAAGVYNANNTTGATTLNLSGNSADAKVTNLAASVKTLVTDASNGSNDINLAYAAGTPGTLTWNIGKAAATGNITNGDLYLTNVGALTINAVGSLKAGTTSVVHGGDEDIFADNALKALTLTTSIKGVNLEIDDLYERNDGGLDGLQTLTVSANRGNIDFYGNGSDSAKNLTTLNVTAANGASADVQYVSANGVTSDSKFETSKLSTVNVSATGKDSYAYVYEIYAGGGGDDSDYYGVAATNPEVAVSIVADGEDAGAEVYYLTSGSISSLNVSATGAGSYAGISQGIYVMGVAAVDDDGDEVYQSGGNVGSITLSAGVDSYAYIDDAYVDGSIGSVSVQVAEGGETYAYLYAGYGYELYETVGSIGEVTIAAADDAYYSYTYLEAYDNTDYDGDFSSLANVGNITITAGRNAQVDLDVNAAGSVGNIEASFGINSSDNDLDVYANGSIGTTTLTLARSSSAYVDLGSGTAIGDVTATIARDATLYLDLYGEDSDVVAGDITASGAGDIYLDADNGSLAEIGTVNLSGMTGYADVDLSNVDLGTTIRIGTGNSYVKGTAGNDEIILTAGEVGDDRIDVQSGSVIDVVRNFNIVNDALNLNSVFKIAKGTYGDFTVSEKGIATGGTLAAFKTLVNGESFVAAGVLAFFDSASSSLYVAYTDDTSGTAGDQIIQLVGVTGTAVAALSGGVVDILNGAS